MVKLPKDFIAAGYEFDAAIPSAKLETARTPEGSVVLRVGYETNAIEEFAQQVAHETNKKVETAIMDELLRLNGYVPERTCEAEQDYDAMEDGVPDCRIWRCSCGEAFPYWRGGRPSFCTECGAKLVKE